MRSSLRLPRTLFSCFCVFCVLRPRWIRWRFLSILWALDLLFSLEVLIQYIVLFLLSSFNGFECGLFMSTGLFGSVVLGCILIIMQVLRCACSVSRNVGYPYDIGRTTTIMIMNVMILCSHDKIIQMELLATICLVNYNHHVVKCCCHLAILVETEPSIQAAVKLHTVTDGHHEDLLTKFIKSSADL